jgi:cytochrome oxidase Cu insertion factor (SCO1/SenC/PrrC family)
MYRRFLLALLPLISLTPALSTAAGEAHAAGVSYRALRAYGGDFTLTDHNGQRFSLHDARGKIVLIYFGFTSCADTCPLTLAKLGKALRQLGPLSERVQTLFISVDPQRDSPDLLRQYVTYFHPTILALTGRPEEIAAVAKQYRAPVYVHKPDETGFYVVDHSSYIYVVDGEGVLVNLLRFESSADKIAQLLRDLLEP